VVQPESDHPTDDDNESNAPAAEEKKTEKTKHASSYNHGTNNIQGIGPRLLHFLESGAAMLTTRKLIEK